MADCKFPAHKLQPELGTQRTDHLAATLRGIAGAVPVAGGVIAEIINYIIPNQRTERFESYLMLLAKRLQALEASAIKEKLTSPENIDLFEDGARQAIRAISKERMEYIVAAVADGITNDDRQKLHSKRLLSILEQLDDEEILILHAYAQRSYKMFEKLRPPPAVIGASTDVIQQNAMWDAAKSKLEILSLLKFKQDIQKVEVPDNRTGRAQYASVPVTDSFGHRKGSETITPLGRLLLKAIGFTDIDRIV